MYKTSTLFVFIHNFFSQCDSGDQLIKYMIHVLFQTGHYRTYIPSSIHNAYPFSYRVYTEGFPLLCSLHHSPLLYTRVFPLDSHNATRIVMKISFQKKWKVKVGTRFPSRCANYMNHNTSFKIFYIMSEAFYISISKNDKDKISLRNNKNEIL